MTMIKKGFSFLRVLPNYIIIGAQKSGTSSLFYYLSQHPQVVNSNRKEVHYFDKNYHRSVSWYKQHFPFKFNIKPGYAVGEATPSYLFHPFAAERIYKLLPDAKLIVVLRHPVERVISQYFQAVRKNNEHRPLMQALQEEEEEERIIFGILSKNELTVPKDTFVLYKARSRYAEQLERYYNFFPREQLLILSAKALLNTPNETLKKVYSFLNINEDFYIREMALLNVGTNKQAVSPEVISYLTAYFEPYNEALFQLLGYKIDW